MPDGLAAHSIPGGGTPFPPSKEIRFDKLAFGETQTDGENMFRLPIEVPPDAYLLPLSRHGATQRHQMLDKTLNAPNGLTGGRLPRRWRNGPSRCGSNSNPRSLAAEHRGCPPVERALRAPSRVQTVSTCRRLNESIWA